MTIQESEAIVALALGQLSQRSERSGTESMGLTQHAACVVIGNLPLRNGSRERGKSRR